MKKKPIYDDDIELVPVIQTTSPIHHTTANVPSTSPASTSTSTAVTASPTPTDRLAGQIRRARLQLYNLSTRAESSINNLMTRALRLETSFTNTVASLAPPKTANEPLVPGLVYVLVATMAGSIVSRNRNFLLRATVPVLFGVGAGWAVIPYTMRNVGDLVWFYERKYPVVADTHLRIKEQTKHIYETGKAHTMGTIARAEGLVEEGREKMEGWVKRGK